MESRLCAAAQTHPHVSVYTGEAFQRQAHLALGKGSDDGEPLKKVANSASGATVMGDGTTADGTGQEFDCGTCVADLDLGAIGAFL